MVQKNEPVDPFGYNRWIDRVLLLGEDGETPISDTNRIPISASLEVSDLDIGDVNLLNIAKDQINPATLESQQDTLDNYKASDEDNTTDYDYYSYLDKDGNWIIEQINNSTMAHRYIKGTSDYTTNWTNRASLTYNYFNEVF